MLVPTIFASICAAAVLFLLRFLLALATESKSSRAHRAEAENHTTAAAFRRVRREQTPSLILVHSRGSFGVAHSHTEWPAGAATGRQNSRSRGA